MYGLKYRYIVSYRPCEKCGLRPDPYIGEADPDWCTYRTNNLSVYCFKCLIEKEFSDVRFSLGIFGWPHNEK